RELLVESTHHLFVLVLQLTSDEFACFSFQITDRLLSCMKVNADIYWVHSASFQSHVLSDCVTGREFSTHGGRRCFITSVPPRGSGWSPVSATLATLDEVSTACGSRWMLSFWYSIKVW